MRQAVQMQGRGWIQAKGPGKGIENLRRRMVVFSLLKPHVVINADTRQPCDLLTSKTRDPPPAKPTETNIFRANKPPTGPEVLAKSLISCHLPNVRSHWTGDGSSPCPSRNKARRRLR